MINFLTLFSVEMSTRKSIVNPKNRDEISYKFWTVFKELERNFFVETSY